MQHCELAPRIRDICFPTHPELRTIRIVRYRHIDLHIVGSTSPFELPLDFDHVFHPTSTMTLHARFHPYQWLDRRRQAVGHELKFSIRWDERDGSIVLEARETNTLMEFNVFHLDRLAAGGCPGQAKFVIRSTDRADRLTTLTSSSVLKHYLIVQSQSQLRHTR